MGSEAGPIRPPLSSRTFDSRPSAVFQREQLGSPTSYQSLLTHLSHEFQGNVRILPDGDVLGHRFGFGLHVVGIASANGIKVEDFQANFPDLRLRRLQGKEIHGGEVFHDAKSKALSAAATEQQTRRNHPFRTRIHDRNLWKANPVIGLDQMNAAPTIVDGEIRFVRLGKPARESHGQEFAAIQKRFADLAEMAVTNNWPSVPYITENATYIHYTGKGTNTDKDAYSVRQSVVFLDPSKLAYLATPEGFAQYLDVAKKDGLPIEKVAGGLKLEVFEKMGTIQYVTSDVNEIQSGVLGGANQEKELLRAHMLSKGGLDLRLHREYIAKFPPTLLQRIGRKRLIS